VFHFKKFSIDDSMAAMKIGTDSVLLGAWVPCGNEVRIIDIGTGSGILALMMAQRNQNATIDAVELDFDAANAAQLNINVSPWPGQVHVYNTAIQQFAEGISEAYSLLICNPPFFNNSLKTPHDKRNFARHNDSLPAKELIEIASRLITRNGKAALIIPAGNYNNWLDEASRSGLFLTHCTWVKSYPDREPHRVMVAFAKSEPAHVIENELSIYDSQKVYSQSYRELTKEFYLKF
jgi:tRNA1Val (adenine37-N6)-methyltransferase